MTDELHATDEPFDWSEIEGGEAAHSAWRECETILNRLPNAGCVGSVITALVAQFFANYADDQLPETWAILHRQVDEGIACIRAQHGERH